MTFYRQLSVYYDEIFPASAGEMSFLRGRLEGLARILDLGCGTGNKTEFLAGPGREIIGLDFDEDMIELARLRHQPPGVSYLTGDMTAVGFKFPPARFDGLICLGNTLAHLVRPYELEAFMAGCARVLRPGGFLAVQILNYDWLGRTRPAELPVIETERVVFRRFYDWLDQGLRFRSRLEIKGGSVLESDIPLRPLRGEELNVLLSEDFSQVEYFGGYDGRPHQPDSFVTLALARRR